MRAFQSLSVAALLIATSLWALAAPGGLELRLILMDGAGEGCAACMELTRVDDAGEPERLVVRRRPDMVVRPGDVAAAVVFESAGTFERGGIVTWLVVGLKPERESAMREFMRSHSRDFVALGTGDRVLARTNLLALWPVMTIPFWDGRSSLEVALDLIGQPLRLVEFDEELSAAMQTGGVGLAAFVTRLEEQPREAGPDSGGR